MIDVDLVRIEAMDHGKNPRVHPNGFIQLDLYPDFPAGYHFPSGWEKKQGHSGANRRLHIWNPPGIELPRQQTVNEIHDHVFDMESTVIKGALEQRLYAFVVGASGVRVRRGPKPIPHRIYRCVYDSDESRLEPYNIVGDVELYHRFVVYGGTKYMQPAFSFHDTHVNPHELVVTVMEKVQIHEGDAHVLVPEDTEPDNSFDRAAALPEQDLWAAIERSLAP